jgi:hypothetical protein
MGSKRGAMAVSWRLDLGCFWVLVLVFLVFGFWFLFLVLNRFLGSQKEKSQMGSRILLFRGVVD